MRERLVVEAFVIRNSEEDPVLVKKFVVEALDAAKVLVIVAFVAVRFPSVVAPVTSRAPERERLVPEALARTVCPVTVSAVVDAKARLVCPITLNLPEAVRLVVEAFVRTEVEAKILEVNTLRNLSALVPRT